MGELTPLQHALSSVVGLAQAEHQLAIVARMKKRAADLVIIGQLEAAEGLRGFAKVLESEVDIEQTTGRPA